MTALKVAALLAGAYLALAGLFTWLARRVSWTGTQPWPATADDDADLRTIDEARAEFEDRMHVVGVHAHDDGATVTRRTLRMPWLSVACSSERHGACRADEWSCECACHRSVLEASAS